MFRYVNPIILTFATGFR